MSKIDNLTPFEGGENWKGNRTGRPKNSKNRSTIARMLLETQIRLPEHIAGKLKEYFPNMPEETSVEFIMTLGQIAKSITNWDTSSYNAVFDSAYGKAGYVTPTAEPVEELEVDITKEAVSKQIWLVAVTTQDPSEKLKALDMLMKINGGYVTVKDIVNGLSQEDKEILYDQLSKQLDENEERQKSPESDSGW